MSAELMAPDRPAVDPRAVRRKVARRILPLSFVLYVIAYLDRANAGFVKEEMRTALGFTDDQFGLGYGIFFAGYLLLEVPGALLVEHWSARKWFARILVTWGLCSMGLALVRTPGQFYFARFLLGLAEAGFFPGLIVYFTHWFPRADRGRALAGMVLGVPVSVALGAQVSGLILRHFNAAFDLAGWQWVFLIEGAPAVLLGLAVPFLLTDRPRQATWLTPAERDWLDGVLAAERQEAAARGAVTLGQALRRPTVWLLALGIMAANTGGYAMLFWMPSAVGNLLTEARGTAQVQAAGLVGLLAEPGPAGPLLTAATVFPGSDRAASADALNWTALIYLSGLLGVWLAGQSSDRSGDRKWHCVAGMALCGVFLALSVLPGLPWAATVGLLCLTVIFGYFWPPPFWVLPTLTLSASAAAVSIGVINMAANAAGLIGNPLVGFLKNPGGWSDRESLLVLAGFFLLGGAVIALLRVPRTAAPKP